MKKIMAICSILFVMSAMLLVGCSSKDTSSSSANGVVKLKMATWAGGDELKQMQSIVDKVNQANKKSYQVTLVSIPDNYYMKVQTQLSAGNAPDLLWMSQEQIKPFILNGALTPIDKYYKKSDISKIAINDQLMGAVTDNGKTYGLPWIANPVILYYNKNIVDAADQATLEATTKGQYITWDQFHTMAKKYTDIKNDKYGTVINGSPAMENFIWSYGGEIQKKDGTVAFDSPQSIAGIQKLADFVVNDPISPNQDVVNKVGYGETFQQGKTAFIFGGVADNMELISGKPAPYKVGYAVAPNGGTPATFNWSASTVITKDCNNPEVAFKAMSDLTQEFWKWKSVPPVKDITQLGYADYTDYLKKNSPQKADMAGALGESMKIARIDNYGKNTAAVQTAQWEQIYSPILSAAVTGKKVDVHKLVENAMAKVK
ncbi:sugar ABC transporter substrate-binding protein [Neobacillus sp. PS3-34]|uniref:ABC transporter substrate-binding protein n=1 Tax=Neobacillus sp. PS3-34 TaxID=3070678 RepID=UPI0027DF38BA|nr:sugar ABC transporter substrate-binding protein [Neobacillus sp. PS3-34]WML49136.1 sugar ABC transporter substrate-binding protein [Neobacillus sp. PS3-34]